MEIKSVGIVGYGHFGMFIQHVLEQYAAPVVTRIYSRRHEPDGVTFFSLAEVATSDVVIVCGAISEFTAQVQALASLLRPETLLVDVATVKLHTTQVLATHIPTQLRLSCHPMFGPESYKKQGESVKGLRIVVTDHTLSAAAYMSLKHLCTTLGFEIIEITADAHDRMLAETLFLTHYIGQTMKRGEFGRTIIDTVSFSYLMDAVESVQHDDRLFADVYCYNPHCATVAQRFHTAQQAMLAGLPPQAL